MVGAELDQDGRSVSIGQVFTRAFGTLGSNPATTLGIAFLFGALPSVLIISTLESFTAEASEAFGTAAFIGLAILSILFAILLAMITQGALVRATIAYSEGRKARFGECARAGLGGAVPLFLLGLVSVLGIALGFLLLIVPAIFLYVIWSVAAPALVGERLGPIEALGRSADLTKGARWTSLGLTLVVFVLYMAFWALVAVISVLAYGGLDNFSQGMSADVPVGYLLINGIAGTITSAVWGTIQTSLYIELRNRKDGPRTEKLAQIFG